MSLFCGGCVGDVDALCSSSGKAKPRESPSYMNHFRDEDKRGSSSQFATMKSKNDPSSADFTHFFKTGKVSLSLE